MRRALLAFAAALVLPAGCKTGLEVNQAAQRTELGGSGYQVPTDGDGSPLAKTTKTYREDGSIESETVEPTTLPYTEPASTAGPIDRSLTRMGPEWWEVAAEANVYVADIGQQYAYANSPQDVVEIYLGAAQDRAGELGVPLPSIRGSFTGNIEIFDEDQDGTPERVKASKSDVLVAMANLYAAYESARKAIAEGVVAAELHRYESIEEVEKARVQAIRDITVEFFAAARALASGGASEIIPGGGGE
jgi:hypothetical protein